MISGIYILLAVLAGAVIFLLVLRVRYTSLKSGSKDKNRNVQRIIKKEKGVEQAASFLPGSRSGDMGRSKEEDKGNKADIERLKPDKKRFSKLGSKEDIKRAFLLEELLRRKVR
ncbi:MAG: hypothetical protein AAFR66_08770 [Bacteroidota bacterium]